MSIAESYEALRKNYLVRAAEQLRSFLEIELEGVARIERISCRAKAVDRFVEKASKEEGGERKYERPLSDIQDLIGARVIVFYLDDVDRVVEAVKRTLTGIEVREVEPATFAEFGYFGWHAIFRLPSETHPEHTVLNFPEFFELQIKTLFQHAWAEAEHDLIYKMKTGEVSFKQKRLIAFAAAQAWGADNSFQSVLDKIEDEQV